MKLYKWVTAIRSEGKPIIGHMIIEKAKFSIIYRVSQEERT
jgi:hypothetical protein